MFNVVSHDEWKMNYYYFSIENERKSHLVHYNRCIQCEMVPITYKVAHRWKLERTTKTKIRREKEKNNIEKCHMPLIFSFDARSNNIFIDEVVICRMSTEKKMVFMLLTLRIKSNHKREK